MRSTGPGSTASAVLSRRGRAPAFDPSDAAELWDLVNKQDWAICESVQRGMSSRAYTHGWFAPMEDDSADIRRWLLPRLGTADELSATTYVVVGLGALGCATAYELARRGHRVVGLERFALGHDRGASHDTSRILRHSYHTPAYVRLTQEAYDDWARLEARLRRVAGDRGRRARPLPARPGHPVVDYVDSLAAVGIAYELLDVAEIGRRWPQFRCPTARWGSSSPAGRSCPPAAARPRCSSARRGTAPVLRDHAGHVGARPRRRGVEVSTARRDVRRRLASWSAPTPGPTTCSAGLDVPCR